MNQRGKKIEKKKQTKEKRKRNPSEQVVCRGPIVDGRHAVLAVPIPPSPNPEETAVKINI